MFSLPKKITASWLKKLGACDEGVSDFKKEFPNGVAPSVEALKKMSFQDVLWLGDALCEQFDLAEYYTRKNAVVTVRDDKRRDIYESFNKITAITKTDKFKNYYSTSIVSSLSNELSILIHQTTLEYQSSVCNILMEEVLKKTEVYQPVVNKF